MSVAERQTIVFILKESTDNLLEHHLTHRETQEMVRAFKALAVVLSTRISKVSIVKKHSRTFTKKNKMLVPHDIHRLLKGL